MPFATFPLWADVGADIVEPPVRAINRLHLKAKKRSPRAIGDKLFGGINSLEHNWRLWFWSRLAVPVCDIDCWAGCRLVVLQNL